MRRYRSCGTVSDETPETATDDFNVIMDGKKERRYRYLEFVVVVLSVPVRSSSCSSPVPSCSSSCLVARLDPGVISSPLFTSPPHDTNRSSQSLRQPKSASSIVCSSVTACV
ncbi:hypothetical protein DPX16_11610 [Anabarilius grahami]|uniref:Uncharacterized protein n=1 Tax=Anabarilius grahami TaxID=495550 RepID=A0A3N0YI48_ANAGA|nr:hypothetical protein DPX16_11610 [Anabarilius grahami]